MVTKVKWLGYAFFEIITEHGVKILIDPYITGGEDCPSNKDCPTYKRIQDVKEADLVLVTHGSEDHGVYDAPEIVKNTDAMLMCAHDVKAYAIREGVKPEKIGDLCYGNVREFKNLRIRAVEVVHGSWIRLPDSTYMSYEPLSFIIHTESDFRTMRYPSGVRSPLDPIASMLGWRLDV